jgi:copper resistance protein C
MTSTHSTGTAVLPPDGHRTGRQGLKITAAALLLTLLVAAPAHGHATLLETVPADGAELEDHPSELVLTFDEAVEPAGDALVLTDGAGAVHDLDATAGPDTGQISAEVPPDTAAGEHTVAWRIVAADGHVQEGELAYTVTASAQATDDPEPQEAEPDEPAVPDAPPADEDADAVDAEAEQDLDAEALGATGEDEGGAGWIVAMAVLVAAAVIAGALTLGGRRRSAAEGEA